MKNEINRRNVPPTTLWGRFCVCGGVCVFQINFLKCKVVKILTEVWQNITSFKTVTGGDVLVFVMCQKTSSGKGKLAGVPKSCWHRTLEMTPNVKATGSGFVFCFYECVRKRRFPKGELNSIFKSVHSLFFVWHRTWHLTTLPAGLPARPRRSRHGT